MVATHSRRRAASVLAVPRNTVLGRPFAQISASGWLKVCCLNAILPLPTIVVCDNSRRRRGRGCSLYGRGALD